LITDAIQKWMSLRSIGSDAKKGLLKNLYKLVLIEAGQGPLADQIPFELGQVSANYFLLDTCGILE
jgi:hypothetical protein